MCVCGGGGKGDVFFFVHERVVEFEVMEGSTSKETGREVKIGL